MEKDTEYRKRTDWAVLRAGDCRTHRPCKEYRRHNGIDEPKPPVNEPRSDRTLKVTIPVKRTNNRRKLDRNQVKSEISDGSLPNTAPEITEMEQVLKAVVINQDDAEYTEDPIVYGDITLTDSEKLVLRLRPEFALFPDLDVVLIMEEIEACLAKLRWDRARADREREEK